MFRWEWLIFRLKIVLKHTQYTDRVIICPSCAVIEALDLAERESNLATTE